MRETLNELVEEVRDSLGNPTEAEISVESIKSSIIKAVEEYSRFRPVKKYFTERLIKGQELYKVPADVVDISDVVFCTSNDWNRYIGGVQPEISRFDNPSLATILFQKIETISYHLGNDWEYADGNILIIPAPNSNGYLVYSAKYNHTLEKVGEESHFPTVPQKDKQLILMYAIGECMERIGRRRNKKVTQVPTVTGNVKFDQGRDWRTEGNELKKEFYSSLGMDVSTVVIG